MRRSLSVLFLLTMAMWMGLAGAEEPPKGQVAGTAVSYPAKKHKTAKHHKAKSTKQTQPGDSK